MSVSASPAPLRALVSRLGNVRVYVWVLVLVSVVAAGSLLPQSHKISYCVQLSFFAVALFPASLSRIAFASSSSIDRSIDPRHSSSFHRLIRGERTDTPRFLIVLETALSAVVGCQTRRMNIQHIQYRTVAR
jgi:hypothetical protein